MWRQPQWTRLLPARWVLAGAMVGGLGRLPAPGTWGSLAGTLWVALVCERIGFLGTLGLTAAGLYLAFALCGEAEKRLARIDPPEVVLDEFASMPLVFLGLFSWTAGPRGWCVYLAGFALFRLFDIAKPFGIRRLQRFVGGAGVVLDDVAAAAAAGVVLHVLVRLPPVASWLAAGGGPAAP